MQSARIMVKKCNLSPSYTVKLLLMTACASSLVSSNQTCTKQTSDCNSNSHRPLWRPFRWQGNSNSFGEMFTNYTGWHNRTLLDDGVSCEMKEVLVFRPNAGLGDSMAAATAALNYAISRGRLFFIDWVPYNWSVGLQELPFTYDLTTALAMRSAAGKSLVCVDRNSPSDVIVGHVTSNHPITSAPELNTARMSYEELLTTIFQPSPEVRSLIDATWRRPADNRHRLAVSLVIRTGEGEYNQFLSRGDEIYFVRCFENYVRNRAAKHGTNVSYRVFVASDQEAVKRKVVAELAKMDGVRVVTLNDSVVHLMHVQGAGRERIVKTFAEYFIIGDSKVLFLTHGSLFGRSASERGAAHERDVHMISDSKCDGKRDKFSYLDCAKPKYPLICGFS